MWDRIRRWRTWLFNAAAFILLILPDILRELLNFGWGSIVPQKYMGIVTLVIVIVNVAMRPRPAVLPTDPEAKR